MQRQQRRERPAQPDRRRERGDRADAQIVGCEVERERAAHRLSRDHHVVALATRARRRPPRRTPPSPASGSARGLRGRAVAGKHRCVAAKPVGREHFAEAAQLRGGVPANPWIKSTPRGPRRAQVRVNFSRDGQPALADGKLGDTRAGSVAGIEARSVGGKGQSARGIGNRTEEVFVAVFTSR